MFWFVSITTIFLFFFSPQSFTECLNSEEFTSPKRQLDNSMLLPDCSVDGDCSNFPLASFCTKFSCVSGVCTISDRNPCNASNFEICSEKTQSCVGCSLSGDMTCSGRTVDYLSKNQLSFCDASVSFTCSMNHPVVKSNDQTEIGRVLYGDCALTQYNTSNDARCLGGGSVSGTPFCSSSLASCVECITNVDCLVRFGLLERTNSSSSSQSGSSTEYMDPRTQQPTVVPGCLPPIICSRLDGKCYFHNLLPKSQTVPFSDPSIYDVLSSQSFYINYSDASKGYNYWSTKYMSHIMQDPCDSLEQKSAIGGEEVLTCSMVNSGSCAPVTCTTDVECDDFDECNGKEFCQSGTCRYSLHNTCGSQFNGAYPFCDETNKTCEPCLRDSDCETGIDPCQGMGYCGYNTATKRNACSIIPRCNPITETCNNQYANRLTSTLLQFSYSIAGNGFPEVPENLRNRTMRNWRTLNTYDDVSFYIQETFLANQDFNKKNGELALQSPNYIDPVGVTLDEKIVSFVNSFLGLDTSKTGFLPLDFDSRRIYCDSIYCSTNGDCPIGTICTTYSKFNQTRKKCVTCDHDHQCQDGVKCNGREKCHHSEGTCRRSKYPLCYNKSKNKTYPCDERTGRCIGGGISNNNIITESGIRVEQSDHITNTREIISVVPPPADTGYIPVSQVLSNSSLGSVLSITLVVSLAGIFAAVLLYVSLGNGGGSISENAKFHRKRKNR